MDFDGFLVSMRIAVEGVDRAAAPLWELAAGVEALDAPCAAATATDERCP